MKFKKTIFSALLFTTVIGIGQSIHYPSRGGGGGGVVSVTGSAPITSTGGNNPVIGIPQANSTQSGFLASSDFVIFSNKGSGTVTAVTGTTPVVSSGGTTPAISMPQANATQSGYLSSADWTTFNNGAGGAFLPLAGGTMTGTIHISGSTVDIGSGTTDHFRKGFFNTGFFGGVDIIDYSDSGVSEGFISGTNTAQPAPDGTNANFVLYSAVDGQNFALQTGTGTPNLSGSLLLETNNAAAGNSGNILLYTGTASGTRGSIIFQDGSQGTASQLWASQDTHGTGAWAAPLSVIPKATTSQSGYLSSADWTTFNSKQAALSFTTPLNDTSNTVSIPKANATQSGYLSSADWVTFNNGGFTSQTIKIWAPSGHGSSGTHVVTYSNNTTSGTTGSLLTYNSDATNGDNIVVNFTGATCIAGVTGDNGSGTFAGGISINASNLTQNVWQLTAAQQGCYTSNPSGAVGIPTYCGVSGWQSTNGDVFRSQDSGASITDSGSYLNLVVTCFY